MSRIITSLIVSTIVAIILQGCATVGREFLFSGPQEIQIGATTKEQVIRRFGNPFRVGYDSGFTQWTYAHYRYFLFGEAQTKDLVITFGNDHKVKNYTYNSSLEDDRLKILSK